MPIRILIVDDEPHLRAVMKMALEDRDYEIYEAESGEDALAQAGAGVQWDAILLDERMPGLDGLQTLQALRERDPECVVIMVTAYASIELAVDAMKLGATDFVQKPMSPETLRNAVAAALAKSRREWVAPPAAGAESKTRSYEVWSMNGFHVVDAGAPISPTEHRFSVVQGRSGPSWPVIVSFNADVVEAASEHAERPLAADGAFWMKLAGLALAKYVWDKAAAPADGRLVVDRLSDDAVRAIRRERA
jgi:DNA-binding response OmpR family regulator